MIHWAFVLVILICLLNCSLESKVTPRYFTELVHLMSLWLILICLKFRVDLSPNRMATVLSVFILTLRSLSQMQVRLFAFGDV